MRINWDNVMIFKEIWMNLVKNLFFFLICYMYIFFGGKIFFIFEMMVIFNDKLLISDGDNW